MTVQQRRSPVASRTWVPGPGGYVIAAVITTALFALPVTMWLGPDIGPLALLYLPLVATVFAFCGLPVEMVWAVVLHLTCRRVHADWIHVLVAGLVAAVLVPPWFHLAFSSWFVNPVVTTALAGASAGLGRFLARRWVPQR
jgi:hypothetical protein